MTPTRACHERPYNKLLGYFIVIWAPHFPQLLSRLQNRVLLGLRVDKPADVAWARHLTGFNSQTQYAKMGRTHRLESPVRCE